MRKKLMRILPLILVIAIGTMSIRLFVVAAPQKTDKNNTEKGVSYLAAQEKKDGDAAASLVKDAQEAYDIARANEINAKARKTRNYKPAFKHIVISGDSIVKAIWEYGILDKSQVIAEINAGSIYLKKNIKKIVKAKPKYLILHYGENEVTTKKHAHEFKNAYAACIKTLQKKLPNTKIYVDSIFPVQKKAFKKEPYLKNIPYYNTCIKEMAEELGVTYINYNAMWKSFDENYYDADGVHPLKKFYTVQYLPFILERVSNEQNKKQ